MARQWTEVTPKSPRRWTEVTPGVGPTKATAAFQERDWENLPGMEAWDPTEEDAAMIARNPSAGQARSSAFLDPSEFGSGVADWWSTVARNIQKPFSSDERRVELDRLGKEAIAGRIGQSGSFLAGREGGPFTIPGLGASKLWAQMAEAAGTSLATDILGSDTDKTVGELTTNAGFASMFPGLFRLAEGVVPGMARVAGQKAPKDYTPVTTDEQARAARVGRLEEAGITGITPAERAGDVRRMEAEKMTQRGRPGARLAFSNFREKYAKNRMNSLVAGAIGKDPIHTRVSENLRAQASADIGKNLDAVAQRSTGKLDATFAARLGEIRAKSKPPAGKSFGERPARVAREVDSWVKKNIPGTQFLPEKKGASESTFLDEWLGAVPAKEKKPEFSSMDLPGEEFQRLDESLRNKVNEIRRAGKEGAYDRIQAFKELRKALGESMESGMAPADRKLYRDSKKQYAILELINSPGVIDTSGNVDPVALAKAQKSADKVRYKRMERGADDSPLAPIVDYALLTEKQPGLPITQIESGMDLLKYFYPKATMQQIPAQMYLSKGRTLPSVGRREAAGALGAYLGGRDALGVMSALSQGEEEQILAPGTTPGNPSDPLRVLKELWGTSVGFGAR